MDPLVSTEHPLTLALGNADGSRSTAVKDFPERYLLHSGSQLLLYLPLVKAVFGGLCVGRAPVAEHGAAPR